MSPKGPRSGYGSSPTSSATKPTRSRGRSPAVAAGWSACSAPRSRISTSSGSWPPPDGRYCDREHFALILDAGGDPPRQRRLAAQLRDQQVDGLILSPLDPDDEFWPELAASVAVVSIGDALNDGAAGEVLFDNRFGVRTALEHLHGLGHRDVAVLLPPRSPTSDRPAEQIVAEESARLKLAVRAVSSPYDLEGARATACELLTEQPRPTAAFCFSDSIAHGIYAAATELGLAIPDQLSVIGYDDHPISELLSPPLTSFDWDVEHVVSVAVDMVLAAIDSERPRRRRRVVVEPVLRVRGSTAPPG